MDFETLIFISLRDLNFDSVDHLLTEREIKLRYRELAMKFHPDKQIFSDSTMMVRINEAKEFLLSHLDQVNQFLCRTNPQILRAEAIRREEAEQAKKRAEEEKKKREAERQKAQAEEERKKREQAQAERRRKEEAERKQREEQLKKEREMRAKEERARLAAERKKKLEEERKFQQWYNSLSPKEKKKYDRDQIKKQKQEQKIRFLKEHPNYYRNLVGSLAIIGLILLVSGICVWRFVFYPVGFYNKGIELYEQKEYQLSFEQFKKAGNYKESSLYLKRIQGELLILEGNPYEAGIIFGSINKEEDYLRSKELLWNNYVIAQTIAMSSDFMVAIQNNGSLVGMELNQKAHTYEEYKGWKNIEYLAMTEDTIIGICSNGAVLAEGKQKSKVSKWKNIVQIYTAGDIIFGLKADGRIIHTSSRGNRVLKEVLTWENVVNFDIFESRYYPYDSNDTIYSYYAAAVLIDGTVKYSDNDNSYTKEISDWNDIIYVSLSYGDWIGVHIVGLKKDNTVLAVGSNHNNCCNVSAWKNIIQVHTLSTYTFGLTKAGTIVLAGSDAFSKKDVSNIKDANYMPKIENLIVVDKNGNLQCESNKILAMADWKNIKTSNNPFYE